MNNTRLSSLLLEENHVECYTDGFEDAGHFTKEIDSNFQETPPTDEQQLVSIKITVENLWMEAKDNNFRPPPRRKKTNNPQVDPNTPKVKKSENPHRPEVRHCIISLRKDPHNTWRLCKHKWRSCKHKRSLCILRDDSQSMVCWQRDPRNI